MDVDLFRASFARVSDAYGIEMPSGRPKAERKTLTDDLLRDHLAGKIRLGAYTTDVEGLADQIIIDIDIPKEKVSDPKEWERARVEAKRVLTIFDEHGIDSFITSSKSRGYHVRALWEPSPAADLRKVGEYVVRRAGIQAEVFPKQDKRTADGLGNFVWLPLHGASLGAGKTAILSEGNGLDPMPDQWEALRDIRRNAHETLAAVQGVAEEQEKEGGRIVPPVQEVHDKIVEGKRRDTLTSIAGTLRRRGLSEKEILPTLIEVNRTRCIPPVSEKDVAAIARSIMRYKPEEEAPPEVVDTPDRRITVLENMHPRPVLDLLQDETLTSPEEVFEGLLAIGEATVLGGPPKAMKSWTIKSMGLCAAAGGEWLGFPATRPFKVLLLSAEGREVRLRERFQKLIAFTDIEEEGLQRMEYLSTGGKLKIDTDAGERTLMRLVEPFEVVILDPLYRFIAEGDENSHSDARRVQDVLDRVKEAGKCVLLVHHVRKSIGINSGISELRGAGLDGFVDGAMMLSRKKEDSDERFQLDFTLRNFEDPTPMELSREGIILIPATKAPRLLRSNIAPVDITKILESFGGEMTGKQLYSQIKELKNVSHPTAERAVAFAASSAVGLISSKPSGGRGSGRTFYLLNTPAGGSE